MPRRNGSAEDGLNLSDLERLTEGIKTHKDIEAKKVEILHMLNAIELSKSSSTVTRGQIDEAITSLQSYIQLLDQQDSSMAEYSKLPLDTDFAAKKPMDSVSASAVFSMVRQGIQEQLTSAQTMLRSLKVTRKSLAEEVVEETDSAKQDDAAAASAGATVPSAFDAVADAQEANAGVVVSGGGAEQEGAGGVGETKSAKQDDAAAVSAGATVPSAFDAVADAQEANAGGVGETKSAKQDDAAVPSAFDAVAVAQEAGTAAVVSGGGAEEVCEGTADTGSEGAGQDDSEQKLSGDDDNQLLGDFLAKLEEIKTEGTVDTGSEGAGQDDSEQKPSGDDDYQVPGTFTAMTVDPYDDVRGTTTTGLEGFNGMSGEAAAALGWFS